MDHDCNQGVSVKQHLTVPFTLYLRKLFSLQQQFLLTLKNPVLSKMVSRLITMMRQISITNKYSLVHAQGAEESYLSEMLSYW